MIFGNMTALAPSSTLVFWRPSCRVLLPPIFAVTTLHGDEFRRRVTACRQLAAASEVGGLFGPLRPRHAHIRRLAGGFLALRGSVICCPGVLLLTPEKRFVGANNPHLAPQDVATAQSGLLDYRRIGGVQVHRHLHLSERNLAARRSTSRRRFSARFPSIVRLGGVAVVGRAIAWRAGGLLCVIGVWAAGLLLSLIPSVPATCLPVLACRRHPGAGVIDRLASRISAKTGPSAAAGFTSTRSKSAARRRMAAGLLEAGAGPGAGAGLGM